MAEAKFECSLCGVNWKPGAECWYCAAPEAVAKTAPFQTYLIDYDYDGSTYGIEIRARGMIEATERHRAIARNGRVVGVLKLTAPFIPVGRWVWFAAGAALGLIVGGAL